MLWVARSAGRDRRRSRARRSPAERAGIRPRRRAARDRRRARSSGPPTCCTRCTRAETARASTTRCCAWARREVVRDAARAASRAATTRSTTSSRPSACSALIVGAAVRLRRPGRSSDAALLLALPGVLRHVHLLVQRAARSARLGLLLGRRGVDPAAAAALPALHARFPRAAAQLAAHADRAPAAAAAVRAGARCSASRAWWRWRVRRWTRSSSRALLEMLDRFEPLYLAICFAGGLVGAAARASRDVRSVTARRQLRWIVWGTALGAIPFAARVRAAVRRSALAPTLPMELSAVPAEPGAARVCVGHRPLPPDGRRGDRQARAGLRRRARRRSSASTRSLLRVRERCGLQRARSSQQPGHRAARDAGRRAARQPGEERDPGRRSIARSIATATTTGARSSGSRAI